MGIVAGWLLAAPRGAHEAAARRESGFTLLELLVVMVIVGVTLGAVTLTAMPDSGQDLREDARRIALLLQLARDEAVVRNRPVAFEADAERYRFLVREENVWRMIGQDELLREREFKQAPVVVSISGNMRAATPSLTHPPGEGWGTGIANSIIRGDVAMPVSPAPPGQAAPLRIVFGREPVGQPFVLTLSAGEAQAAIRADGAGHFTVD